MAKSPPELTPAEFSVMKALWELGSGNVADIRAKLSAQQGTEPAYTTVMTLLGRMATKGAVRVDRAREPFVYRPALKRQSALRHRLREFLETVFDGRADELILQLVEEERLSEEDIRRIERKLGIR
jgi:BlaI family penicillinase repressor